jgi:O-antigen ligase
VTNNETRVPAQRGVAPAWASACLLGAEWACVLAAVGLWASERSPQGIILLGTPLWVTAWVCRWLRLGQPSRPTALDWPLLAFLLTALIGLWAAPSLADGLARLDLFLGAVGLYYLLANSPQVGRHLFAYGLGALAALLAVYFASQHDWTNGPAKFAVIGEVGRLLNRYVPQLKLYQPNPNIIANLLALVLPAPVIQATAGLAAWRRVGWLRRVAALFSGLCALIIVAGLVMTESRASALALGGAASLAGWWWLAGQFARRPGPARLALFLGGVSAAGLAIVAFAVAAPNLLTLALGSLPGPNSTMSRTELYGQVWRLAQDTPFTGGGLAAFPGLYSTYILDVPNLYLTHAHNAYLNVLVEQGWPGLLSFVAVLGAALVSGARRWQGQANEHDVLVAAGLLGLAVLVLQGLGDGTLVASPVALAWLIPAGLAVGGLAVPQPQARQTEAQSRAGAPAARWPAWLPWAAGLAAIGCLALLTWHSWLSAWYANMGEVAFARIQLEADLSLKFSGLSKIRPDSPCFTALHKADLSGTERYVFLAFFVLSGSQAGNSRNACFKGICRISD